MTKREGSDYPVGYGRPPLASRFSSTNQPARSGLAPLRLRRKTMVALAAEKVTVSIGNGRAVELPASEVIREQLIQSALRGNVADARELYSHLDREEDAAALDPNARRSKRARKKMERVMDMLFARDMAEERQLVELGVIEMADGERRVPQWLKDAAWARPRAAK